MKKRIFISLSISTFFFISSFCQDLSNLDIKFGINRFKLESSFELYKTKLTYKFDGNEKVKYYYYSGKDITELFGVTIDRITLGFYNKKLYTISYFFKPITNLNEKVILSRLKDLFGTPDFSSGESDLPYQWGYSWETNKTFLQFSKYTATTNYQPNYLSVFIFSKKLKQQIDNDNF